MTMKIQAMLDWSPEEKAAKAKEWAQSLFTLRLQKATGQLENPMKIKELRKDIARLKTAQNMGASETAAAAAHEVAHAEGTEAEAKTSANEKSAAGTAKPKAHAVASGKGAKKRAAAHRAKQKKTTAGPGKGHSPSKKSSSGASAKKSAAPKAKSAAPKKSKKK
jgi:large subunit ribosomal protein L29